MRVYRPRRLSCRQAQRGVVCQRASRPGMRRRKDRMRVRPALCRGARRERRSRVEARFRCDAVGPISHKRGRRDLHCRRRVVGARRGATRRAGCRRYLRLIVQSTVRGTRARDPRARRRKVRKPEHELRWEAAREVGSRCARSISPTACAGRWRSESCPPGPAEMGVAAARVGHAFPSRVVQSRRGRWPWLHLLVLRVWGSRRARRR
eukprot:6195377-Pleurochrysis_carterae.AAC.2